VLYDTDKNYTQLWEIHRKPRTHNMFPNKAHHSCSHRPLDPESHKPHEATSFMQSPALQSYLERSDGLLLVHHEELLHAGVVEHAPLLARAYKIEVGTFISVIDLLATVSCYAAFTSETQHHSSTHSRRSHHLLRVVLSQQL
jgi:hypothetical protein